MKNLKKVYFNDTYVFVILIFFISICVFIKPLNSLDELWNFNFARNIYNGNIPYVDFNMITTPLSAYIASVFLEVFGSQLLSVRILGFLVFHAAAVLFYIICVNVSGNKAISGCITVYLFLLHMQSYVYEYNGLNLLMVLIAIFIMYKDIHAYDERKSPVRNISIGFILGLTPIIKQSTGVFLLLANLIICIMEYIMCHKSKRFKRIYILRAVASMVPGIIFVLWLTIGGAMSDFWDYGVCGIRSFKNGISYLSFVKSSPVNFILGALPIITCILFIRGLKRYQSDEDKRFKIYMMIVAAVYMIPMDIYNKDIDMLLIGNTGTKSAEEILDNGDNTLYLLLKDREKLNWQSDYRVLDYIRKNYGYFGEVSIYEIYKSE